MKSLGYSAYKSTETQVTDNKGKILLLLYDGAIRFTRFARMGMERKDPKIKGENISKVIAIITELDCALDQEKGKELAENLAGLYQYMLRRLTHANVNNEVQPLEEVERLLNELKEAFETAAQQLDETPKKTDQQKEVSSEKLNLSA